jgi:adenylate cyclase
MIRFNAALTDELRLRFRIGVHLGEVIVDEEDQNIFGDGVNLAAHIQAIAEPGGITVSRTVRDVAELQVEYAFVDGGEHQLKNVNRLVQVFHVRVVADELEPTTTTLRPMVTLHFKGVDSTGKTFDLALSRLMTRGEVC